MVQFTDKQRELCKTAWGHFGQDNQIIKTVEELNELATELMHYRDGKSYIHDVTHEMADVLIMCQQLIDGMELNISKLVDVKMARLHDTLENGGVDMCVCGHDISDDYILESQSIDDHGKTELVPVGYRCSNCGHQEEF